MMAIVLSYMGLAVVVGVILCLVFDEDQWP
jgi:hypothetical protein